MKKRMLSMLLAVVMVLSMVPVQALAEDVTLLEETTVEPTAAVTEPEQTEAAQTEPVETVPEETEETEPAETAEATEETKAAEETEATEETTEATEETTEETEEATEPSEVAVEFDAEVLNSDPDDLMIVPCDEIFEGVLALEGTVALELDVEDGADVRFLYWWSDKPSVAAVDSETGVVKAVAVGEANIYVDFQIRQDGKYVEARSLAYPITVVEKELPRYQIVLDADNPTKLIGGNSITLSAHVVRLDEDDTQPLPTIIWKLYEDKDAMFVTVKSDGTVSVRDDLTYKRVDDGIKDESVKVQVCFADEKLNEKSKTDIELKLPDPVAIDVYPKASKIELGVMLPDFSEGTITDGETFFNLNDADVFENGLTITAKVKPEDETNSPIIWQVNDSKKLCGYTEDSNGDLVIKARSASKTGTVTVIAKADDGSGVSQKIVVRFEKLPEKVEILNLPEDNTMRGLSTVKLTTNVASMKGLTDKTVLWKVVDADDETKGTPYARIDASGNLTANRVDEEVTVKVIATTGLGNIQSEAVTIRIVPAVESVTITYDSDLKPASVPYNFNDSGKFQLKASVEPAVATQKVTWSTSNANIAAIDQDGNVTIYNSGRVRITATATDGSKKSDYLYLTITKPVYEVQFDENLGSVVPELRSGKTYDFSKKITAWTDSDLGVKAANQKFTWQVFEEDPYEGLVKTSKATITSSGKLSVKDISENAQIVIRATSQEKAPDDVADDVLVNDKGYAYNEYTMTIKPKDRYNFLLYVNGENVTGKTVSINNNDYTVVTGCWYDSGDVGESATAEEATDLAFTSSSKTVATIDKEFGDIYTLKRGTTTITVQGRDGAGKLHTAKFTLKVTNLVEDISISTSSKGKEVRSGSSLTLKATTWTDRASGLKATNQKVTWSIADEDGNPTNAATISTSGVVKAKTVTKDETVVVTAKAAENGQEATITLTIRPKSQYTLSLGFEKWDADGQYASGTVTVPYNLDSIDADNLLAYDKLKAFGYSAVTGEVGGDDDEANEGLTWSTSSKSIVSIEKDDEGNTALKVHKAGKVTLTAKKTLTVNGKKTTVSAKITLNLVVAAKTVDIVEPTAKLYAGKTLSMRATLNQGETAPSNRRLKWSLADEDKEYATINATSGVITANRKVNETDTAHKITVTVESLDGYGSCEPATKEVTILPTAKAINAQCGENPVDMNNPATASVGSVLKLSVTTTTEADPDIKWASSNTSVASIKWDSAQSSYVVTAKKKGKATITATALDGSGKTAKFIIQVN